MANPPVSCCNKDMRELQCHGEEKNEETHVRNGEHDGPAPLGPGQRVDPRFDGGDGPLVLEDLRRVIRRVVRVRGHV